MHAVDQSFLGEKKTKLTGIRIKNSVFLFSLHQTPIMIGKDSDAPAMEREEKKKKETIRQTKNKKHCQLTQWNHGYLKRTPMEKKGWETTPTPFFTPTASLSFLLPASQSPVRPSPLPLSPHSPLRPSSRSPPACSSG